MGMRVCLFVSDAFHPLYSALLDPCASVLDPLLYLCSSTLFTRSDHGISLSTTLTLTLDIHSCA